MTTTVTPSTDAAVVHRAPAATERFAPAAAQPGRLRARDLGSTEPPAPARTRVRWPLTGAAAGITGLVAAMASITELTKDDYASGVDVVGLLDRSGYHASFVLGLVSIGCLLLASSGWRRWAEERGADGVAARTIPTALAATAAVNLIGVAMAGSLALYLPGGTDAGFMSQDGLFVIFTYLDFGLLLGWWGVLVAALCVAALAFGRRRLLPRWMGVVSIVFVLPPLLMGLGMGLPGMPGLTMPIWLTVISIGMAFGRGAKATAR